MLLVAPAAAVDWPQWRGPQRNGISTETGFSTRWGPQGPKKLWSAQVGEGFASVAVKGARVYTLGNTGQREWVTCLNADTGKVVWRHGYPGQSGDYGGPRATPTVDGNAVYTFSREAAAFCLDAATGKVVWNRDLRRETGAEAPRWGFAGSPLVEGNLVIYNVGPAGAALDKTTGRVAWQSGRGAAGYASPVAFRVGSQQGVALFTAQGLVAVDGASGRRLWDHPWNTNYDVNAADPIFSFDTAFVSSNYGRGGALLRVGAGRPQVQWENRSMRNHFNTCVLLAGSLYGNDDGKLTCLDLRTGQERWRGPGIGKGGLIAADGRLIVLSERGELLVVQATPARYTEQARAQVMGGTCWTPPALANGRIYCRSHEGELVCLDVRP